MTTEGDFIQRAWSKLIFQGNLCWIWTGYIDPQKGYGRIGANGKGHYTHRYSFECFRGAVPDGLVLDHLCRNRSCCNPCHLEAVTIVENLRRGMWEGDKTHCPKGHAYSGDNLYVTLDGHHRKCRACHRDNQRRYRRMA